MKKLILPLVFFLLFTASCTIAITNPAPTPTLPSVVATMSAPTQSLPTATSAVSTQLPVDPIPTSASTNVQYGPITLDIPASVAGCASLMDVPRFDSVEGASWQKTPGHTLVSLTDCYALQGKANQPQITVFQAMPYVEILPAAFESIHRLDNILYGSGGTITADQLPAIPFYNSVQTFVSNIQPISFQNGNGIRFLAEYGQSPISVNNQDLFYVFQGLSRDGTFYIVAIFPVTNPILAETPDGGAPLPEGGIPYQYMADPTTDMQAYYQAVANLLGRQPDTSFLPNLTELDRLIQSIMLQ